MNRMGRICIPFGVRVGLLGGRSMELEGVGDEFGGGAWRRVTELCERGESVCVVGEFANGQYAHEGIGNSSPLSLVDAPRRPSVKSETGLSGRGGQAGQSGGI